MARKLIIDNCDDCPFFDNEYHGYDETCTLLDRVIKRNRDNDGDSVYWPPSDCPLPEVTTPITRDTTS